MLYLAPWVFFHGKNHQDANWKPNIGILGPPLPSAPITCPVERRRKPAVTHLASRER
jgi:hypothetical protein